MPSSSSLEQRFEAEMWGIHETAKQRCRGYQGTRFAQMLKEHGGVETAKRLLESKAIHDGFTDLLLCGCSHLTAEFLMLKPEYGPLFSDYDRSEARRRLGRTE